MRVIFAMTGNPPLAQGTAYIASLYITVLLQPVQIQAWFQKVLFFPVGGISVIMRKQSNL